MTSQNHRFVPCNSCGMYRLMQIAEYEQYLYSRNVLPEGHFPALTCHTCHEKLSLLDQVNDLNTVIATLQERIESLTQIRTYENDIDELSAQFARTSLGDVTIPPESGAEVTLGHSQLTNNQLENTSLWSSGGNNSSTSNAHMCDTNATNPHVLENIVTSVKPKTNLIAHLNHTNVGSVYSHKVDSKSKELNKFCANETVTTILVGGKELKAISISPKVLNTEEYFKIANPNANLHETTANAKFFIDKIHKKARSLVLQVGTSHIEMGHSETMKESLITFSTEMKKLNIDVIISGPIPYNKLTGIGFSRLCAINDWLGDHSLTNDEFRFIDNSDFFQNEYFFSESGRELSNTGSFALRERITKMLTETREA